MNEKVIKYRTIQRDPNFEEYIEKGFMGFLYAILYFFLAITCPIWGPFWIFGKIIDGQITEKVYHCPEDDTILQKIIWNDGEFRYLKCSSCFKHFSLEDYNLKRVNKNE